MIIFVKKSKSQRVLYLNDFLRKYGVTCKFLETKDLSYKRNLIGDLTIYTEDIELFKEDKVVFLYNTISEINLLNLLSGSQLRTINNTDSMIRFSSLISSLGNLTEISKRLGFSKLEDKEIYLWREKLTPDVKLPITMQVDEVCVKVETDKELKTLLAVCDKTTWKIATSFLNFDGFELQKIKVIGSYTSIPEIVEKDLKLRVYLDFINSEYKLKTYTTTVVMKDNLICPISIIPSVDLEDLTEKEIKHLANILKEEDSWVF